MRRLTVHQVFIEPQGAINNLNRDRLDAEGRVLPGQTLLEASRQLDIPDGADIIPLGLENTGGGNPEAGRWRLDLLVVETLD